MNPEDLATDWIVSRLEADSELMGMVSDIAPNADWETLPSPFVRVDYLDGSDLLAVGPHRVWTDCEFSVRGVYRWEGSGQPDRTEVNAIGERIDDLLHDVTAVTADLEIEGWREEPNPIPSVVESGRLWLQSGGIYRFHARAVAAV